jgi:hypothetical protein
VVNEDGAFVITKVAVK